MSKFQPENNENGVRKGFYKANTLRNRNGGFDPGMIGKHKKIV